MGRFWRPFHLALLISSFCWDGIRQSEVKGHPRPRLVLHPQVQTRHEEDVGSPPHVFKFAIDCLNRPSFIFEKLETLRSANRTAFLSSCIYTYIYKCNVKGSIQYSGVGCTTLGEGISTGFDHNYLCCSFLAVARHPRLGLTVSGGETLCGSLRYSKYGKSYERTTPGLTPVYVQKGAPARGNQLLPHGAQQGMGDGSITVLWNYITLDLP